MAIPKELQEFEIVRELDLHPKRWWLYFLYDNNELVYIGKSINHPAARVRAHIKDKEFTNAFFAEIERDAVLEKERALIRQYKPKYNQAFLEPVVHRIKKRILGNQIRVYPETIKKTMKKQHISNTELAKKAKISYESIRYLFKNNSTSMFTAKRIAKALNINISEFKLEH
jgi:DNA-binding phage protein